MKPAAPVTNTVEFDGANVLSLSAHKTNRLGRICNIF